MSYHSHDHHLTFLPKKETTSLNIAHALISFAEWLIGIFIPIYLWVAGIPLWQILTFHTLVSVGVLLSALLLTGTLRRMSDKTLMLLAIPIHIVFYLALPLALESTAAFAILPLFLGMSTFLFNTGFNVDFSKSADEETVGRTVGMRYVLVSIILLIAPSLGGVLISTAGFGALFVIASILLLLAVLLLLSYPSRKISRELSIGAVIAYLKDKSLRPFNLSSMGYAGEKSIGLILWTLFLFLAFGSVERFGLLVSAGLAAGLFIAYLLGYLTDHGKRSRSIWFVVPIHALLWLGRLFVASPLAIAASYVAGAVSYRAILVPWESQYYLTARATHIPEVFVVSREVLYNGVRVVLLASLAAVAWAASLETTFTLGFVFATFFSLLFLSANWEHRKNLDSFIKEGK